MTNCVVPLMILVKGRSMAFMDALRRTDLGGFAVTGGFAVVGFLVFCPTEQIRRHRATSEDQEQRSTPRSATDDTSHSDLGPYQEPFLNELPEDRLDLLWFIAARDDYAKRHVEVERVFRKVCTRQE